jgi:hypothetical protein
MDNAKVLNVYYKSILLVMIKLIYWYKNITSNIFLSYCFLVIYRFEHEGHCNGGFRGRTIQNNIVDCYNKCAEDSTVGYFAYAEKSVEKWCACYLANAGCPDDKQHNDHKAYKLLRGILLINKLFSKCVYIYISNK